MLLTGKGLKQGGTEAHKRRRKEDERRDEVMRRR